MPPDSSVASTDRAHGPSRASWLLRQIDTLYPGCFALVMATGIVSNAFYFESPRALSDALFAINLVAYPLLLILTIARALRVPQMLAADLLSPRLVFAFFTLVAGTDVLGVSLSLRGYGGVALGLWLFALILWVVLIYLSFAVLTFLNKEHRANVIDGGWLLAIVGTESLVVLGTSIGHLFGSDAPLVFVALHMLWGIGLALYGIFITLFAYRIFFFAVEPEDVNPLLWVVMGAAAISTNAGSVLILTGNAAPFLQSMVAFIDGATLVIWAWATWWIPLLVLLGIWKHAIRRVPLSYTPTLWGLVFPLGMYALASLRLSQAADVPVLQTLSQAMVWVALAAWIATAFGFVAATWRDYRRFAAIRRAEAS
ncbi:MAG TPA: tellurite resistance/C4-dicarboxylate transporter family protein [Pseudolabrys sp.]|nr:tellurite resistance/C4-dicarboxylate transporter family protein [Pseudolabrys sp.]